MFGDSLSHGERGRVPWSSMLRCVASNILLMDSERNCPQLNSLPSSLSCP